MEEKQIGLIAMPLLCGEKTYIDDKIYVAHRDERTDEYERQCGVKAHEVGDDFYQPKKAPTKILLCEHDEEKMKDIEKVLRETYSGEVGQVKSKPYFFEMTVTLSATMNAE